MKDTSIPLNLIQIILILLFSCTPEPSRAEPEPYNLIKKGTSPFDKLIASIEEKSLIAVYILPQIQYSWEYKPGVEMKDSDAPKLIGFPSMGKIDDEKDLNVFVNLFKNDSAPSNIPQLLGGHYEMIFIINDTNPRVPLRVFHDRGEWFFLIEIYGENHESRAPPLRFFRKSGKEFSKFITSRMVNFPK